MIFAEAAQVDTSALQIGVWIGCLTAVLVCVNQALSAWRYMQPRPPMDEQLRHVEQKIMKRLDDQDEKAEERVTKLHERINGHTGRIGYIEGHLGIRNVE